MKRRVLGRGFVAACIATCCLAASARAILPPDFDRPFIPFFPVPVPPKGVSPEPPIFFPPEPIDPPPPVVNKTPEPGTIVLGLIGVGIAGLNARRKKRMAS